jgi:hypothetical protein
MLLNKISTNGSINIHYFLESLSKFLENDKRKQQLECKLQLH